MTSCFCGTWESSDMGSRKSIQRGIMVMPINFSETVFEANGERWSSDREGGYSCGASQ